MKSKEEILKDLFVTLAELQHGNLNYSLEAYLKTKLEILYDILGEDVPEEYWEQIEEEISK